ncbi:hypothetical protein [Robinsoniella peoriensis]|uniref:hypothetical protein n=1 Tax=Robinsoniella peoriensis TaxID=180332 RepID=UPI000AE5EA60|nr:hypothetical protein [Robinsoniella peoriensis]
MNKFKFISINDMYLDGIKLQDVKRINTIYDIRGRYTRAELVIYAEYCNDTEKPMVLRKELQNTPHEAPTYKPVIVDKKKIKLIADWYGYEPQSRQCIEEMSELTQAINKLWRKRTYGGDSKELSQARKNVLEEIADVSIMICQMKELLGVKEDELSEIINQKLDRQLERINTLGKQLSEIPEDNIMIKCTDCECIYGHCCIECDAQKSKGPLCGCNIAEDCVTREEILKICPYAEEAKSKI